MTWKDPAKRRAYRNARYRQDPEYRARALASQKRRRVAANARRRERYAETHPPRRPRQADADDRAAASIHEARLIRGMRALRAQGFTLRRIGELFGVSAEWVSVLLTRKA